jgi:DNA-binding MarR family transcriptional regulator
VIDVGHVDSVLLQPRPASPRRSHAVQSTFSVVAIAGGYRYRRPITLRQLLYFVTVVDEGNFTRAAQSLHVAQPSLSKQIQTLESELGAPLFSRARGHVALTPAGEARLASTPHVGRIVGQRLLAGFSREEREQLAALLERAARNLEAAR